MNSSKWLRLLHTWLTLGVAAGGLGQVGAQDMRPPQEHASRWVYQAPEPLSEMALRGQRLYLDGVRADGQTLQSQRQATNGNATWSQGTQVACVQCHRRSGLGTVEGDILIAPITGRALYEPGSVSAVMDTRSRRLLNTSHAPYTLESLGQALRHGIHVSGRSLHPLMPRYQLSDDDVQNLDAYLKTLSPRWSPGVTTQQIRIASVITPDVDEKRRGIAVDTIRALVNRKNLATRPGRRHMVGALEFVMRTERRWEHEIWELSGPKETWLAQLQERQAKNPVFAIASGVSGDGTALHTFCESQSVPCWFPVVESLPAIADQGYYGLYFGSGVRLEARAIAQQIPANTGRVLQLISGDASAQSAAAQVEAHLPKAMAYERLVVGQVTPQHLAQAMDMLGSNDVLVLWLRATDVAQLQALPVPAAAVWLGGGLAGGERATMHDAWRRKITMSYPYELPWLRTGNLVAVNSWLALNNKPLLDEALQSQLYFALSYLGETLSDMLNNLHRDYLLERADMMLGRREAEQINAQLIAQRSLRQAARDLQPKATATAPQTDGVPQVNSADLIAQREGSTVYPRLSLGPGQRFASKGVWLVRFAPAGSPQVFESDARWMIPEP